MKTLLLMRHAKSCWQDPHLDDLERPLNPRGRKAAKKMGRWIAKQTFSIDLVLCSPSIRTQQTLNRLEKVGGLPRAEVQFRDDLYFGGRMGYLSTIQSIDHAHNCALLLGHNPSIEDTLFWFAGSVPKPIRGKMFPTASLAWLEVKTWQTDQNQADLVTCVRPKLLEEL